MTPPSDPSRPTGPRRGGLAFIHNRPIDAPEANVGAVVRMAAAFARAGVPVDLTAYAGDAAIDPFERNGVERTFALQLTPERQGALSYPSLVLRALTRGGGEVVYTRVPQIALYGMAMGRRAVLEMHTPIGALRQGDRLLRVLNLFSPRLQGLVAISPALDQRLRAELPRYKGPRVVAPSAASDLAAPAASPPDHDLGYVGGLTAGKGAAFALDVAQAMPDLRLLLVGDVSRQPELTARAAALANVTLLGAASPADMAGVMARFRIALAPYGRSVQGSGGSGIDLAPWMSPLKIAEYASAHKTVVASRLPGVEAMVSDGREARLCEPEALDEWVTTIRALLAAPAEMERLAAAARSLYEARLSWDARARRIIEACRL